MASALELRLLSLLHNPWKLNVHLAVNQSVPNNTGPIIKFDTVDNDPNSNYAASTGQYTCPVDGYYAIAANVIWAAAAAATGGQSYLAIYKNAVEQRRGNQIAFNNTTTNYGIHIASPGIKCVAGDLLDIRALQQSGAALNALAGLSLTWLDIVWIGPS